MDRFVAVVGLNTLDSLRSVSDQPLLIKAILQVAPQCNPPLNDLEVATILGEIVKSIFTRYLNI
jgi:hypothetical protein